MAKSGNNRESSNPRVEAIVAPACPGCHETAFVKYEQVLAGATAIAFWTCSSCLRSWPATKPRMVKADLKKSSRTT